MGIVGQEDIHRPFWTNMPLYELNDCECGGTQEDRTVYVMYVGAGPPCDFWVVRCSGCGKCEKGDTIEEACIKWNRGGDLKRYRKKS